MREEKNQFLPISREDAAERGWEEFDFIFINGDAYVDHPSFGGALICRWLERQGYRVGMIPQPDWRSIKDFKRLGKPKLAFLVSAGNLDSMLNRYTAAKKLRSDDAYSPGGKSGFRPERATLAYCSRLREAWKGVPIIIGGIEASLRRFVHYDYWSNSVRRSMLVDSGADLLVYGMGERQVLEIARQLEAGTAIADIRNVRGTCYLAAEPPVQPDAVRLPSYEQVVADKQAFAEAGKLQHLEQDPIRGKTLIQQHGDLFLVQNPPARVLSQGEMDTLYSLPFMRNWHPQYDADGGIPAIQEVRFSVVSHRGCFGGCTFCALVSHQGRIIQSRSKASIVQEVRTLTQVQDFKGYIHDVGGPTANFRQPACQGQLQRGTCRERQCLYPKPCKKLEDCHDEYLDVLQAVRQVPGVKKVFIRSGVRYDYLLATGNKRFLKELCLHHVSGQMKIAPEHISDRVTGLMGKAGRRVYQEFAKEYARMNQEIGKEQYLVPYFMSSFPGCGLTDAVTMAEFLRDMRYQPEQVQDFIPTPGSLATCMYYTGIHPLTGERLYVAREQDEKKLQRALLQYRDPKNYALVVTALQKAGREDLIGYGPGALIRPRSGNAGRSGERSVNVTSGSGRGKGKERNKSADRGKTTGKSPSVSRQQGARQGTQAASNRKGGSRK